MLRESREKFFSPFRLTSIAKITQNGSETNLEVKDCFRTDLRGTRYAGQWFSDFASNSKECTADNPRAFFNPGRPRSAVLFGMVESLSPNLNLSQVPGFHAMKSW